MLAEIGIIGGTGIGSRLAAFGGTRVHVPTPDGSVRGQIVAIGGSTALLLQRHSAGHKVPPHRVNYRAMALALRQVGIRTCLSTAAVGSLHPDWLTGDFVVCDDFIDLSGRNATLFERQVKHQDLTYPMGRRARSALLSACDQLAPGYRPQGTYVTMNGPRYETPAEISSLRTLGGDVVGMTAGSEAISMAEAGIDYACLAIVTNLAAGLSPQVLDHQGVVDAMESRGAIAVDVLLKAAGDLCP